MKILERKYAALALAVMLAVMLTQAPNAYSAKLNVQEKALSVITEVVGLDMTKYKAELYNYNAEQPDIYGGLVREDVVYTLESAGSKMMFLCEFINGTMVSCFIYTLEGSPLYAQPLPANILDATKSILQRLQIYSGASLIQTARSVLDRVTEIKPMNVTMGNLKLRIDENDNFVDLTWWNVVNGIDFPTMLSVHFEKGKLKGFADLSSFYRIGSANVKISREEAIRIAWEQAKTFTTLNISLGDTYAVVPFKLVNEPLVTEFKVACREPLTWYPFWHVRFYSDKAYYGITGVQVGIWADTGEIEYCQLAGFHGAVSDAERSPATPNEPSQSPEPSPDTKLQSESILNQPQTTYVIAGIAAIAMAVAVAAVILKKKRSK